MGRADLCARRDLGGEGTIDAQVTRNFTCKTGSRRGASLEWDIYNRPSLHTLSLPTLWRIFSRHSFVCERLERLAVVKRHLNNITFAFLRSGAFTPISQGQSAILSSTASDVTTRSRLGVAQQLVALCCVL